MVTILRAGRLAEALRADRTIYDRFETLLRDISSHPDYIGPIGVASVAKPTRPGLTPRRLNSRTVRIWSDRLVIVPSECVRAPVKTAA